MQTKYTLDDFKKKANKVHGEGMYDYGGVEYKDSYSKVNIKCNRCGRIFPQRASSHLEGVGCGPCNRKAATDSLKVKTKQFIERSIKIHGSKYKYDDAECDGVKSRVTIFCNTCQESFKQEAAEHLRGAGCMTCGGSKPKTRKIFIEECIEIYGKDRFNYDNVIYYNNYTNVDIKCNICGKPFSRSPSNHLKGQDCPHCVEIRKFKTQEEFINDAIKVHGDKYYYGNAIYKCSKEKLILYVRNVISYLSKRLAHI